MKKTVTLLFFIILYNCVNAQVWTKKMDYPNTLGRNRARAFSIPELGKGYVIGGWDSIWPLYYFDTYEYDTLTNNWTPKAQYPGASTAMATFAINGKGYAGTGVTYSNFDSTFWEFDPIGNSWTKRAHFPGSYRAYAVGFSIGGKGYMGGGSLDYQGYTDFYVYDPSTNTWDTMAACPAKGVMCGAVAFSIGGKGYVGTGSYVNTNGNEFIQQNDFWEYDPATNKWTQKADFPGTPRGEGMGFSTCDKGYIGGGYIDAAQTKFVSDFWQYDPAKDKWAQIDWFGGGGRAYGVGFSIGKHGYVGMGRDSDRNFKNEYDLWEYHAVVTPAFTTDTAISASASICAGQSIRFKDTSNFSPTNWLWTFNGGSPHTATIQDTTVEYDTSGIYDVTLTVWNGCDSVTKTFSQYVHVGVGGALDVEPQSPVLCSGQFIQLYVKDTGTNFTWSPETGLNSTMGDTVIANPTADVTYTVTGKDSAGCSATGTDAISVVQAPNKPTITVSTNGDTLISSATQGNQWYYNDTLISGATNQDLIITGNKTGSYIVEVINPANGCSATSDSLITSGINHLSVISNQLTIYPNPTPGIFFITIRSSVTDVSAWNLEITDVLGRIVFTETAMGHNNTIDLSGLSNGMYFISVSNKADRAVFPVVKQN